MYYAAYLYVNEDVITGDVIISDGVTGIPYATFKNSNITSLYIPDSVTSVDEDAFYGCSTIVSINVGSGNTVYTSIDGNLYSYDETTLIQYAAGKTDTSFIIPDSVTSISDYAFNGCKAAISWGDNTAMTKIGSYAFAYYAGTSITIPDSVTSISSGAFCGCSNLVSITLPFVGGSAGATSASSSTLFGYIFGTSYYSGGTSTKQYYASSKYINYYIPATLTTVTINGGNILYGAFYNCSNITTVTIGSEITTIGKYAFRACSSLANATFENPDGWYCTSTEGGTSERTISSKVLSDTAKAASYLMSSSYYTYYWYKSE